jgi:hypothetical protein
MHCTTLPSQYPHKLKQRRESRQNGSFTKSDVQFLERMIVGPSFHLCLLFKTVL